MVNWFGRGRWVHLRARSFGLSGVIVFTRARPGGRCVQPGSFGSLASPWSSMGSSGVSRFDTHPVGLLFHLEWLCSLARPGGRWDDPGSLASLGQFLRFDRMILGVRGR